MKVLSPQYVAGFFDGEGCIHVLFGRPGTNARPKVRINITQKDRTILEEIQRVLEIGYVSPQGPTCYQLHIAKLADIIVFADYVLPFSRLKRYELVCARVWATSHDRREAAIRNLLRHQAQVRGKPIRTERQSRRVA